MKLNLIRITNQELLKYGIHMGYSKQYLNSQIKPYLIGFRGQFNIFNLKPVKYQLKSLLYFITNITSKRQTILMINHYKESLSLLKSFKKESCFVVEGFWLGGFLTNFKTIRLYTDYMSKKKNPLLSNLNSLPALLVFLNTTTDNWGVKEGLNLNIPIAVATGSNYNLLNKTIYPLVASNETSEAQSFYANLIKRALHKGQQLEKLRVVPLIKNKNFKL